MPVAFFSEVGRTMDQSILYSPHRLAPHGRAERQRAWDKLEDGEVCQYEVTGE